MGWDDELEESLAAQHIQWRAELSILKDISLPRCYFDSEPTTSITLHGFSDASTLAYAATIYIRATYSDGSVSSKLVMAKTRVAPLKTVSVPRLELCGAMMLSELLATVQVILDLPKSAVFAWIDSTVALSWLRGCPSTYKTFVANRVSTAARNVEQSAWKYVPTNENPADCASRGVSALELKEHPLWWEGPSWLKSDPVTIPTQPGELDQGRADEEKKSVTVHNSAAAPTECWEAKFNDYSRLVGCTAYMLRFSSNLKAKLQGDPLPKELRLTVDEKGAAEEVLFQRAQSRHYGKEFRKLSAASPSPLVKGSRLRMVNPFVGEKGLLQVRGRLQRSDLTTLQKQPIILPPSDPVTRMFFKEIHVSLLHCGPTILLANTGLRVYVPGAKRLARSVCQNCLVCKKAAPRTLTQRMGQLPPPRIKKTLCFIHTGVDYAGPFLLKRGNPRKPTVVKGYLAVFICLATKAVHLEVVSALSTEAFLAALRRFIGRRNLPKHLYSDHGSNFLGARNQLNDLFKFLSLSKTQDEIQQALVKQKITWHLIPERAPHMGGIWETAVKSAKHCLKKAVGSTRLTFEEMVTVCCQVEGCLNSRPYLAVDSHDPAGEMPLTSGHFLTGRPMEPLPEEPEEPNLTLTNRWKLCKAMVQEFWDLWQKQYFQTLQRHQKWHKTLPNIKVGDIVMILEESKLQNRWKTGIVEAVYPGEDGLVRTADVRMPSAKIKTRAAAKRPDPRNVTVRQGVYRRAVTKLAPLISVSPLSPG